MDLTTTYMGLKLKNPLVPSASPLSRTVEGIKQMEDAEASAVVLYSLFEEQISFEAEELDFFFHKGAEHFSEALEYFPQEQDFNLGPEDYLNHIRKAKEAVDIPIIASLNGATRGGWTEYAKKMQQAGADGLELNIYFLSTNPEQNAQDVENEYISIVKTVKSSVDIPVAVKMNPFFSALGNMTKKIAEAGADALVLFNRFYQPDLNLEELQVEPGVVLSTSNDLRLPLRWLATLYGKLDVSFAGSTGVHTAQDALKMIAAGADVANLCAALLQNGPQHLKTVLNGMNEWLEEKEYASLDILKGSLSQKSCAEPSAFERANYMKALNEYK